MRICIRGKWTSLILGFSFKCLCLLIVPHEISMLPISNVLVRAVPTQSNPTQFSYTIIFIDAGIATSLQPNDKKNLHDLFKSIVLNDGYTAGQLMVERARYERCTSMPGGKHAFATGVADIVSEFHDRRKQGK